MASIQEMAEAHLINVQREINVLVERKSGIETEIERLSNYLEEGQQVLRRHKIVGQMVDEHNDSIGLS